MKAKLTRSSDRTDEKQGKWISINDHDAVMFSCLTLERPWLNNTKGISCIPTGTYICVKVPATEHIKYPHISVTNVSNRSGVCVHIFNEFFQSEGCIGVGSSWGDINKDNIPDLLHSGDTFKSLMSVMPDEFLLTIE